ncbi:MAG: thioredoxin [Planctomycetota bacterium]|nr:MAG: thioredoxin [Planctomycetota bacterium]
MTITPRKSHVLASLALTLAVGQGALAAGPSARDALSLKPVQQDVDYEMPEGAEIDNCTIKAEGKDGWVVRNGAGQVLRMFTDTDGNNVVDRWSYFKDGVEVYRDLDTNENKKPDQCRWLNTAGSRWGVDRDEDGNIDYWKQISPEEVTAELVRAIRDRDRSRFERILLTPQELTNLGTGSEQAQQLKKKIEVAAAGFAKLAASQSVVGKDSKWISFGGMQPGIVPAGTADSTADITAYENVMAMVETDGKPQPLSVGTMVQVGNNWRLIDLPILSETGSEPFFFAAPRPAQPEGAQIANGAPSEEMQELIRKLQDLPDIASSTPQQQGERADLLEQLAEADDASNRGTWYRQIADSLSAAVQTAGYEEGIQKLRDLQEKLAKDPELDELAAYVEWRAMTAEHGHKLAQPNPPFAKIQEDWVKDLTQFVSRDKQSSETAEAMMELAISHEFGGDEDEALKWYDAVVTKFPESPLEPKAAGAKRRLESPGKTIPLKGKLLNGGQVFDLARLRGKVVLIQYWATWSDLSKADMPLLKELRSKYKDFEVVGVGLDNDPQDTMAFLKQNDPRWPQLYEAGGIENSRYAVEMGIQIVPTMILVDQQGKVVNRNIRADELESELQKLIK